MNAKHEYEFIANFKVLQNTFKAKKVDKVCTRCVALRGVAPNALEAHSDRKTCEMQNAVRSHIEPITGHPSHWHQG